MNRALYHQIALNAWRYTAAEKAVLECMAYHADARTGLAAPSEETVTLQTRWSERNVQRAMASLRRKTALERLDGGRGKGKFTKYRVWPAGKPGGRAEQGTGTAIVGVAGREHETDEQGTGTAIVGVAGREHETDEQGTGTAIVGVAGREHETDLKDASPRESSVDKPVERLCVGDIWDAKPSDLGRQNAEFGTPKSLPLLTTKDKSKYRDKDKYNSKSNPSVRFPFGDAAAVDDVQKQPQPQRLPGEGKSKNAGSERQPQGTGEPKQPRWSREAARAKRKGQAAAPEFEHGELPPGAANAARGVLLRLGIGDERLELAAARSLGAWLRAGVAAGHAPTPEVGAERMLAAWTDWTRLGESGLLRYRVSARKFFGGLWQTPVLWPVDEARVNRARAARVGSYKP